MTDPQAAPPTLDDDKVTTPPANVVADNTGQVPVQPVATSDPTITDNTNPRVPFDGANPRNIPPPDSNEQLHLNAAKRFNAESSSLETAADRRRSAVEAAYMNDRTCRKSWTLTRGTGPRSKPCPGRSWPHARVPAGPHHQAGQTADHRTEVGQLGQLG
jgi:hypothetical protein